MLSDRDPRQRLKLKEHDPLTSFGNVEKRASESTHPAVLDVKNLLRMTGHKIADISTELLATARRKAEQAADSIIHSGKRLYRYVYITYRYLCGARQGHQIQKASRLGLPGAIPQRALTMYDDNVTSRSQQIETNARLAGIHVSEVTSLALTLEGPLLWTEDFALAVIEHPYMFARFLWQFGLYSWRFFGQGFWWVKFYGCCGLMLLAYRLGSAKRAAFPLVMFVLCGLLAGQPFTFVLMICPILVASHWWLGL